MASHAQDSFDFQTEESGRVQDLVVRLDEVQIRRTGPQPGGLLRMTAEGVLPNANVTQDGGPRVLVKLGRALNRAQAAARKDVVASSFPDAEVSPVMYVKEAPRTDEYRRIGTSKVQVFIQDGKTLEEIRAIGGANSAQETRISNVGILTFDNPYLALERVEALRQAGIVAKPMLARYLVKHATVPKDQFFSQQWHLVNTGQNGGRVGFDTNVMPVWDYTLGNTATIAIVDDCLETLHQDLKDNCPPIASKVHHDFNDADDDPRPVVANGDFHGTCVAGLAGARQNNGVPDIVTGALTGVSGMAPEAKLLGLRLIAGPATDEDTANALYWHPFGQEVSVCNNSWGYGDTIGIVSLDVLSKAALRDAVTAGRGGRGQITVFSAGNGRASLADANNSLTSNSRFVTTVGAIDSFGVFSVYSTYGASLLVCAPGGNFGSQGQDQRCTTTDVTGPGGLNPNFVPPDGPDLGNLDYTNQMNGTSSAAPITSGCAALMLSANPELGWRDVKEILASTARKVDEANVGWDMRPTLTGEDRFTNEAGFKFNNDYGSGLIDAFSAVTRGISWKNLGVEITQKSRIQEVPGGAAILDNGTPLTRTFNFSGPNIRLEQIEVEVRITHQFRSQLRIVLQSPSGVRSVLALPRLGDNTVTPPIPPPVPPFLDRDYADIVVTDFGTLEARSGGWVFSTTHHWGENSQGDWILEVTDMAPGQAGKLQFAEVRLFGTASGPERVTFDKQRYSIVEPGGANPVPLDQVMTIRRLGPTTSAFTVSYATTLSTATPTVDFTPVTGSVTFAAGDTSKDIVIPILPDNLPENTEQVNVVLTGISNVTGPGVSFGGTTLASIFIEDDEGQSVSVTAVDNRALEAEPGTPVDKGIFMISRSKVTNTPLTVLLSIGGTATPGVTDDYAELPSQVIIPAFERTVFLDVNVRDDAVMEGTETVTVDIVPDPSYSLGVPGSDVVNIIDNDRTKVQILLTDNTATETAINPPPDTGKFQIRRTNVNGKPLAVFLTFQGSQVLGQNYILRYTDGNGIVRELVNPALTNFVEIPATESFVEVELIPLNDTFYNATKTAVIGLLPNDAYDFSFGFETKQTITINEDDPPLDGHIPTVTISSPKKGSRFDAPVDVVITGTASDNEAAGVKRLLYRVNDGTPQEVLGLTLPASPVQWTVTLKAADLQLGTNDFEISSIDIAGNESKTVALKFEYLQNRTLTVTTTGGGSVSDGFAPSSVRTVGSTLTLTAKPAVGQVFDKWILNPGPGQQEFIGRTLSFVMPNSDQVLNAIFVTSPFTPDIVGPYNGLIEPASFTFENSGYLRANVGPTGAFSGQIIFAGQTYKLKGEFSGSGRFKAQVKRKKNASLNVDLTIDVNAAGTKKITGTVKSSATPGFVNADRAAYSKLVVAPPAFVKSFTLFFPAPGTVDGPQGTGWATMSIDTAGNVKWSGRLPDGSNVSQVVPLSKDGTWPLFLNIYKKRGVMLGTMVHGDLPGSDLKGLIDWSKPSIGDNYYPSGFKVNDLAAVGSIFTPAVGTTVIDLPPATAANATVKLENGNLLAPINVDATIGPDNKVAIGDPNPNKVAVSLNAEKGTFSGSFRHPVSDKNVKLNGVVFQKTDLILGNYLGSSIKGAVLHTGRVTIAPKPAGP